MRPHPYRRRAVKPGLVAVAALGAALLAASPGTAAETITYI
jgi:hypothetical protein